MFKIREYLDSKNIPYKTEGKNVTAGWTNIKCPFPGCSDHSNHCGISPDGTGFSCWICGTKGHINKLLRQIEGKYHDVNSVFAKYSTGGAPQVPVKQTSEKLVKPPTTGPETFLPYHRRFFRKRGYNLDAVARILNLRRYKWGIYIPYYLNGIEVSYSILKWTKQGETFYMDAPIEKSIVPVKSTLFNIDNCFDVAIIVEGFFDVLRFGQYNVCATSTIQFTQDQVLILKQKKFRRVAVMFDGEPDAKRKEDELANQLSLFVKEVFTVGLKKGDPDSTNWKVIEKVKNKIFKNNP